MVIISTINVNGIRAATKKRDDGSFGLLTWLETTKADYVCLQETRSTAEQFENAISPALEAGWNFVVAESNQKGRNGVAILSRTKPIESTVGFNNPEFDNSGRYISASYKIGNDFPTLHLSSLYLPSGEVGSARQDEKMRFLSYFYDHLKTQLDSTGLRLVCGDYNIAHQELDLKNWKANQKNSGFLPEERDWFTNVLKLGWVDIVRQLNPDISGPYSWWSYRGKAFDNDAGWRIDYHLANEELAQKARWAEIEKQSSYDKRWSDHAPVTVCYE